MLKDEWISAAAEILRPYMSSQADDYADSLYHTFVVEDGDDWTPAAAVKEDMNYWEAE
jgi:hypothetical protein